MYAVIKTGGKQHKVSEGDVLLVEKLAGSTGESVEFAEVLLVSDEDKVIVDSSSLSKVKVFGTIIEQAKGKKVIVFKYKPKKGYHRKTGHRQSLTRVQIDEISLQGSRTKAVKKLVAEPKPAALKPGKAKAKVKEKEKEKVEVKVKAKEKAKEKVKAEVTAKPKPEVKVKEPKEQKPAKKAITAKVKKEETRPKQAGTKKVPPKK